MRARKTQNRFSRIVAALLLIASAVGAASNVGFASLKIGIGTRECAMGDAGTASAYGPQSMYWNPALTGWETRFAASASYSDWFLDMNKAALFAVRPTPIVNVGLGATVFNAGTMEFRDDHPSELPIGTFTPLDYSVYLQPEPGAAEQRDGGRHRSGTTTSESWTAPLQAGARTWERPSSR